MSATSGVPLTTIPAFSREEIERLAGSWITTAEQFYAACAVPGGIDRFTEHLGLSRTEVQALAEACRAALAPGVAEALGKPADPGEFFLGARRPHEE